MPSIDIDQELASAAMAGDLGKVSELLAQGADPISESSRALRWAAMHGHAECVRLLLPVSDAKANESEALRAAAINGHAECVRLLLPASDPKAKKSAALRWAGINGHADCARLLLAASGPLGEIEGLLKDILFAGQAKVAALLVEEDPGVLEGVDLSKCLAEAHKKGRADLAAYLSSIMEQRALGGVDPDAAACGRRPHARL